MPDVAEVKEAVEKLGKTFEEFKSVNDKRLEELKKGKNDPLLEDQVKKLSEQVVNFSEIKERLEKVEVKFNRPELPGEAKGGQDAERKAAFNSYIRKGDGRMSEVELKLMSIDSDPQGGYFVTPEMSSQIITKIFETSPFRQVATVENISSDRLEMAEDINQVDAAWTSERGSRAVTDTANVGKREIPVHEMYAQPKATQNLLDDANIDIEAWLSGKVADKLSRLENTAFISGTGVGQPKGILSYTTSLTPTNPGQVLHVVSGGASTLTADAIRKLFYALKSPYEMNASWLMKRSTVQAIALLKDDQNQYIWKPGLEMGDPNNLLGRPIVRMEDMPALGANSLSVGFGDWKRAYTIVDRMGIRALRDPFTAKPFVLFYTTKRTGGDVTNFEAFALMRTSA